MALLWSLIFVTSRHHDGTANFWIGIGLVVLGIAAFFLYRWMSKKGI
jgi:hypothetical protein